MLVTKTYGGDMKPGNSLSIGGSCVHLEAGDSDVSEITALAVQIGAMNYDSGEEMITVRFPGQSSDEAVTVEELMARVTIPLDQS